MSARLLAADEPQAVVVERASGSSRYVLLCDHAGNEVPRALADLGLQEAERFRHIGWDIGALGVARELSALLDAPLVWQRYSRLVIDCNRPHHNADLIPERSEATDIPGNRNLSAAARAQRVEEIHAPYHNTIAALLDSRERAGQQSWIVPVHSFTPVYHGLARPWELGLLYGPDRRLRDAVGAALAHESGLAVGDNEPYRIDAKDHTIPLHALTPGRPNVLFEIRQDLIASATAQVAWARRLATALGAAAAALE